MPAKKKPGNEVVLNKKANQVLKSVNEFLKKNDMADYTLSELDITTRSSIRCCGPDEVPTMIKDPATGKFSLSCVICGG